MNRFTSATWLALLIVSASTAYAQVPARAPHNSFPKGNIEGRVLDDKQAPVAGAMVSVVGRTTAAAITDRDGRYALTELPFGPYVLSVHSRGYWQSHARTIQLTSATVSVPLVQLARVADKPAAPIATKPPVPSVTTTQLAGFGSLGLPA